MQVLQGLAMLGWGDLGGRGNGEGVGRYDSREQEGRKVVSDGLIDDSRG
jgi:hypothetical protein